MEHENLDEVFFYLDLLRESGEVNMMGTTRLIMAEFDVDKYTARSLLQKWIKTYH